MPLPVAYQTSGRHPASASAGRPTAFPLLIEGPSTVAGGQPVATGLPFPKGVLRDPRTLRLLDHDGQPVPLQATPLARWSDGSVKWLLVEFLLDAIPEGPARWRLDRDAEDVPAPEPGLLRVEEAPGSITIQTGPTTFHIRDEFGTLVELETGGATFAKSGLILTDAQGRSGVAHIQEMKLESRGPLRVTVKVGGWFEQPGRRPGRLRVSMRICAFAGTGLLRLRPTLHNPNRARHRGGLWDLGDPGSFHFRDVSLVTTLSESPGQARIAWEAEPGQGTQIMEAGTLEIDQASSGGEHWDSRNHVDRAGRVPLAFRGYRVQAGGRETLGLRASPVVSLRSDSGHVSAALSDFWQQCPKVLAVGASEVRIGLFPGRTGATFELQGGERKTHTAWLNFGGPDAGEADPLPLAWVHQPAHVRAMPEWYAASGAIPHLAPARAGSDDRLESLLTGFISGPENVFARREVIDEYGWRHFGDVYADHEAVIRPDGPPLISHYNNQYDLVYGSILQYLRTGESRWSELFGPLAQHVMDIDIYQTDADKSAYNGGMFWHTDHHRDAATCTHRTFSVANGLPGGPPYGGGPSNEHNYTTGLLHFYYLTGDEAAREAVIGLADWVRRMDDGRSTVFGLLDEGPTGLASRTRDDEFHGPGRGAGNSLNALLDGWLASGRRDDLKTAESLIRRTIHPADDIEALGLRDVEARWSYTVYLSNLDRYLWLKAEAGELDSCYAYARAALVHYATWMLEAEAPYFDHPERLEYPTETWPAQEFRKANVLRLAAAHVDQPIRDRLVARGTELADRAWADLLRFESRALARPIAILLREATRDRYFRDHPIAPAPEPVGIHDFGLPARFVPQRRRVLSLLKSPRGLATAVPRVAISMLRRLTRP